MKRTSRSLLKLLGSLVYVGFWAWFVAFPPVGPVGISEVDKYVGVLAHFAWAWWFVGAFKDTKKAYDLWVQDRAMVQFVEDFVPPLEKKVLLYSKPREEKT